MVAKQISCTWNTRMNPHELSFSIRNQAGNCQDMSTWDTIRDILHNHRLWWRTEQDFGTLPWVRFLDPHSFYFCFTCHRALPAGLAP